MARVRGAGLEDLLTHSDWLGRLAQRLAGPADAEDAVQETWLAAQRSPPDADRPARPWLAGVLRNFLRARWQTDRRRRNRELAQAALAPDREAAVDAVYERVEMQRTVAELVMKLDEPIRIVLLLRYFEGHDSTRIGQVLGLPAGTVRWRLKLALDRLRTEMDARFGDRRTWAFVLAPAVTSTGTSRGGAEVRGGLRAVGSLVRAGAHLGALMALVAGGGLGVGLGVWQAKTAGPRPAALAASARAQTGGPRRTRLAAPWMPGQRARPPRFLRASTTANARAGQTAGVLSGRVRLRGEPEDDAIVIANAIASGRPSQGARAKTGDGGFFHFPALAPGRYVLTATGHHEGTARSTEIVVTEGQPVHDLVIDLESAAGGLHGRVVDSVAGGISRARVRATRSDRDLGPPLAFEAETGCLGRYRLPLSPGLYGFEIEADGYAPARFSLHVPAPLPRSFRLFPAIDAADGAVIDPGIGFPAADPTAPD